MNPTTGVSTFIARPLATERDWLVTCDITDVLWLVGDQDSSTVRDLDNALAQHRQRDVVLNMSGVTFMSASAVGALVTARNLLRADGYTLTVQAAPPCVVRVFDLCGLNDLLGDTDNDMRKIANSTTNSTSSHANCADQSVDSRSDVP